MNPVIQQQPQADSIPQNTREWSNGIFSCCANLGECTSHQISWYLVNWAEHPRTWRVCCSAVTHV